MGGGGGDNGMQMMMTMIMMQQMQQQREAQERELKRQALASAQRAEGQNYQRYQDLISTQNKKVGDEWDLYNSNIDKILKVNPNYNAHAKYTFNPYAVNNQYKRSSDEASANENQDLLNKWYGDLDKQSLQDYNNAKAQYDASKTWLAEAQASQDGASRLVPGALPGAWGAGGGMVSGGAGADAKNTPQQTAGMTIGATPGMNDVFSGFGTGGTAPTQTAASGFISDGSSQPKSDLASVFVGAAKPSAKTSGAQIF